MQSSCPLVQLRCSLLREEARLTSEVVCCLEAFVDARESEIRDVIEKTKAIEHRYTDLLRGRLWSSAEQPLFHVARQCLDRRIAHRPVLARRKHTGDELFAVERLALTGALHHEQHRSQKALKGRESKAAMQALAPAAHGITVFDFS